MSAASAISQRLSELGLVLPVPPQAVGQYRPWIEAESFIFVSGQFPLSEGVLQYPGKLGTDLSDTEGYEAARLAGLNVLSQLSAATNCFESLACIVRLEGHIQSTPDWYAHAKVLDGASELFAAVLGDRAGHARTAFGHSALPLNASVELVVTASTHSV